MSRYHSYLNTATKILSLYKGEEPFPAFLGKFFSQNKKAGSKDRKAISHLCYCYFRTAHALRAGADLADKSITPEEQLLTDALFLCSSSPNELLAGLNPAWNEKTDLSPEEKASLLHLPELAQNIFPWQDALSDHLHKKEFSLSHLQQPLLFLRLRPGKEKKVLEKLQSAGITFQVVSENCISLPAATKLEGIIDADREAVVQDYSSQRVGELMIPVLGKPLSVWDCCAGSGGKSILLYDLGHDIDLTVTDIRESILVNLGKRFAAAGIKKYAGFATDITGALPPAMKTSFDFILCDAPCSGSGTWGRSPEQLFYFDEKKISVYSELQKNILSRVIPLLKPGGNLLYCTCSVFRNENEAVIDFIKSEYRLDVVKTEWLEGYGMKADTLFAALLQKPL